MFIPEAFKRAQTVLGKIDVVINNAGISDESEWRKMIQINLVSGSRDSSEYILSSFARYDDFSRNHSCAPKF